MAGVQIGLRDVHYATLTTDDPTKPLEYGTVQPIIGAISANINPNASAETLFADDGPMETSSTIGQIELELNVADLPLGIQATLLGHTAPVKGEIYRKSSDVPPWVAVGFRTLKSNGEYRYVWLLKGKFRVPEQEHETKGDTTVFKTAAIVGQFVRRDHDDAYQILCDEEDDSSIDVETWFSSGEIETSYKSVT